MNLNYRPDIDGLRAIAVLAVIFFHFDLAGFGGGYVGVDVFFVISGYLIGRMIIDESVARKFTYAGFYARRIKRLFAAFFVVTLACSAAAWWLLLPHDLWEFGKSVVAATVFLPNMLFYRDVGYFSTAAINKPLLHTWSLAVEEQFYILFPIVVHLAVRGGARCLAVTLSVFVAASLAYSHYLLGADPRAAFYWLPSRAWELGLGALVALPSVRERAVGEPARAALSVLAVASIVAPIFLYSEATPFPGLYALPCCLGTAVLLWLGATSQDNLVARGLGAKAPVAIGRISYSLYLWHWPVYVFAVYYAGGLADTAVRLAALAATFALSVLSWRCVEQPFRYTRHGPKVVFVAAAAASLIMALAGYAFWRTDGAPQRLSEQTRRIVDAAIFSQRDGHACVDDRNDAWPGVGHCRVGDPSREPTFLVWGDSHVRAMRDGIEQIAGELGANGLLVWAGGCLPAFDVIKNEPASGARADLECAQRNEALHASLARHARIRNVLLVGRWAYYLEGTGVGIDAHNRIEVRSNPAGIGSGSTATPPDQATAVSLALRDTVAWLHTQGYRVFILEQVPEIENFSSRRLFQALRSGREDLASAIASMGRIERAQVDSRQRRANTALRMATTGGQATLIPTHELFCSDRACSAWAGTVQAYVDNNHINSAASLRIRHVLWSVISP